MERFHYGDFATSPDQGLRGGSEQDFKSEAGGTSSFLSANEKRDTKGRGLELEQVARSPILPVNGDRRCGGCYPPCDLDKIDTPSQESPLKR